jgi:ribosomal protein S13
MEFNFDLNHVEALLKRETTIDVGFAADFNDARARSVHAAMLFVLPLDEQFKEITTVTGLDEYEATEIFAVMIVIPSATSNALADDQINQLRDEVKKCVAGAVFQGWQPVKLHRGRVVEFNKDTGNLIYQCQFSVSGHLTVNTRVV